MEREWKVSQCEDGEWMVHTDGDIIAIGGLSEETAYLIAGAPKMFEALRHVAVLGHGKCTIGKPLAEMVRAALSGAVNAA